MEHKEFTLGSSVYGQCWLVEEPKAVIGIIHGMGEHSGRYNYVVDALNAANISVVSYDQFGYWSKRLHGANKTVRKLIPVTITHVPTTASLHLPNGMRLDAPISALAELLPTLLQLTQAPIK